MKRKIAIQGIQGSFHHQVAEQRFGQDNDFIDCQTFCALVESVKSGESDVAVMAIENSIAGTIIPNYGLIHANELVISGEHYLHIRQHLMALKGQSLADIKSLRSHPMALLQCGQFLQQHPHITLLEAVDTAQSAKDIMTGQSSGMAAIAGVRAAELYNLEILSNDIHDVANNSTRFIVLERRKEQDVSGTNKASLRFQLLHEKGSLAKVLQIMDACCLNLTKIQSLPLAETPWQYAFIADFVYEDYTHYQEALAQLSTCVTHLEVLGIYKEAKK